jgi:O-antigen ligase
MKRETLDGWCERSILALVLSILVFSPLALGAARLGHFLVVQALATGVLLLWLARLWLNPRPQLLWPPICWLVVAFVAYAIGRYLTCDIEYVGRQELLRILVYAALFFAILNNLHRQEYTQLIGFTLIFLAMLIAFYAVYQFTTGTQSVWGIQTPYKGRGSGTYISPNHLAGFLEMLLPLALTYTLVGREKALFKVFLGYAALVIAAGIAVTGSRGSWVSVVVALIFLSTALLFQRNFRLPALALLVVLVGSVVFVATRTTFFQDRFNQSIVAGRVDLDMRYDMWDAAERMWRDHFWGGVGPGHYDLRFRAYRPASIQLRPDRAHNEYLNTLADWGIIGTALVLSAVGALGVGIVKVWKSVRRGENDFSSNFSNKFAFILGATTGLLALLVHSLVDFNLHIPANAILAVSLMALISSHWRFATERYWFSAGFPTKCLASATFIAGLGYFAQQNVRLGREWVALRSAATAETASLAQAHALEQAYALEPNNFNTAYRIAEAYRTQSFLGVGDYAALAEKSAGWYQRGITNNPFNGYNYLGWGMVLDFEGHHREAEPMFLKADELDPNGYFTAANVGKHYVDAGEYAAARTWLQRSWQLFHPSNSIAEINLKIANDRLLEDARDPWRRALREKLP